MHYVVPKNIARHTSYTIVLWPNPTIVSWTNPSDMQRPAYVNMVVVDALAPNRRRAISSHHVDSTMGLLPDT